MTHWRRKFREWWGFRTPRSAEDDKFRQGKRADQVGASEIVAGICLGEILIILIALWLGWRP